MRVQDLGLRAAFLDIERIYMTDANLRGRDLNTSVEFETLQSQRVFEEYTQYSPRMSLSSFLGQGGYLRCTLLYTDLTSAVMKTDPA